MTATILIVDDSELDRRLLAGLLRNNPKYRFELASDGREAVERVTQSPPDIVVTDLIMPEMDGLELVRTLRRRKPNVPVILMTAHGNESTARDALEAGAVSYVPKARQAERLTETLERVLARLDADRGGNVTHEALLDLHATYQLRNDTRAITAVVDHMQQNLAGLQLGDVSERIRVCMALEEALLNAMYHGNLEISPEDSLGSGVDRDTLERLAKERRDSEPFASRRIYVEAHVSKEAARFVIRDEGCGFNPQSVAGEILSEYFEVGRSRGLMLMRSVMDQVAFNDKGNEVTLVRGARAPEWAIL